MTESAIRVHVGLDHYQYTILLLCLFLNNFCCTKSTDCHTVVLFGCIYYLKLIHYYYNPNSVSNNYTQVLHREF